MSDFELSGMTGYPVVILSKSNNISSSSTKEWATEEAQKFFDRYVSKGGGLLAIHSVLQITGMPVSSAIFWRSIYTSPRAMSCHGQAKENMLLPEDLHHLISKMSIILWRLIMLIKYMYF